MSLKTSQNSQEKTCVGEFFYEKKTPTQVLSCEFCEIFKSTFFYRTPLVAGSEFKSGTLLKERIKIIQFKKDNNLQKQSPKVVFGKDLAFPLINDI